MKEKTEAAVKGFDPQDPFLNHAMPVESFLPPPPIVRVEGWQYFVNKKSALRPIMPTADVFAAMGSREKKEFAKQRKKYHSEMPLIETPELSKIHNEAIKLAASNYNAASGARMGIVLDGLGTVGKSSIATELGKKYELSWRKNILPKVDACKASMTIPVVYVTLPGLVAIKDFNRLIVSFMGINAPASASVFWLNDRIIDAMQACAPSLVIIDDIHFLKMRNRSAQEVNNHLKYLANSVSATFVYAGINVDESGLLAEGNSKEKAYVSQTQHRFKLFSVAPFEKNSSNFKSLISSFEASLALMNHPQGTLVNFSDFIHDRTAGFMGAVSSLLREAANLAIDQGDEKISQTLLGKVKLAYASEAHQKTTISKQ
jgi:hypothetical protein